MMKKQFLFLLSFVMLLISSAAIGQQQPQPQKLPVDPAVRKGTLPNGMTYYIYKNEKPKGLADFYIVHNVGAIQEDDNQNGLAHFLEHMAFNGTKSLPGKMMLDYFQANGVEFGRDINAQTGMDVTQYMIMNVPMKREGLIDTAIMAIADWSGGVTLEHKEIDDERGVILEEKRTGESSARRMQEQFLKSLFKDSKYAERNVIGTEAILKGFKYDELKDFYKKWYRPDLQAVVIVGDFDIDQMEAKVKKVMGAIPAHQNPAPKENISVPNYEKDCVCIVKDKEATSSSAMIVSISKQLPKMYKDTPDAVVLDIVSSVVSTAMSERFRELSKQPDAPFLSASFGKQNLTPANDLIACDVSAQEGKLPTAIEAAMKEVTRLYKYGVTEDEVNRYKINVLKNIQTAYDNRADKRSASIAASLIGNFTDNSPILDSEMEYQIYKSIVEQVTTPMINQMIPQIFDQTPVTIVTMTPDKENAIPTEESLLAAYNKGKNAQVEAPKDEKIDRPLVEKQPTAVAVLKETKDELGNTVWTLKNGAKVVIKPTDFRADEIMFSAIRDGGTNMLAADKLLSAAILPNIIKVSGLGTFNATELSKVMTGKKAGVSKSIGAYTHTLSGSAVKADIKTMFELLYLNYTAQPFLQTDYDLVMKMVNNQLENMESQPGYIFQTKCNKIMYGDDPRVMQISKANVGQVNLADIKTINDFIFDGVDGMTFVFVGSIDEKELKPLVEQYIGSLPKGKKKNQNPTSTKLVTGKVSETIPIKLETPKVAYTNIFYTDGFKDMSLKSNLAASMLNDVLDVKYTKSIREEMGATYGVRTSVDAEYKPVIRYMINVSFDTAEDKVKTAAPQVRKEIELIANGASIKEEMEISRGAKIKNFEKTIGTSNAVWINYIMNYYMYGNNYPKDYVNVVNGITEKDVQEIAKKILAGGNEIELIMVPAK